MYGKHSCAGEGTKNSQTGGSILGICGMLLIAGLVLSGMPREDASVQPAKTALESMPSVFPGEQLNATAFFHNDLREERVYFIVRYGGESVMRDSVRIYDTDRAFWSWTVPAKYDSGKPHLEARTHLGGKTHGDSVTVDIRDCRGTECVSSRTSFDGNPLPGSVSSTEQARSRYRVRLALPCMLRVPKDPKYGMILRGGHP